MKQFSQQKFFRELGFAIELLQTETSLRSKLAHVENPKTSLNYVKHYFKRSSINASIAEN